MLDRLAALGLALALMASCGPGAIVTQSGTAPITDAYAVSRIADASGRTFARVYYEVHEKYGYAEVCGAIVPGGSGGRTTAGLLANGFFIEVDGDLVLNDLRRLIVIEPPATPATAMANCIATDVIWQQRYNGARPVLRARTGHSLG